MRKLIWITKQVLLSASGPLAVQNTLTQDLRTTSSKEKKLSKISDAPLLSERLTPRDNTIGFSILNPKGAVTSHNSRIASSYMCPIVDLELALLHIKAGVSTWSRGDTILAATHKSQPSYHPCKNTNVFSSAMEVCNTQRLLMHHVKEDLSGLTWGSSQFLHRYRRA